MKRKFITAVMLTAFLAQTVTAADVTVRIDGKNVDFEPYGGAEPYIQNDRVMMPIRAVAEGMGADVWWNAKTYEVSINDDIVLQIGRSTAYINDEPVELDAPAVIRDDRTYVPLRFVSENMGAKVDWDNDTRCVSITMGKAADSPDTVASQGAIVTQESGSDYFGSAKWSAYAEKYKNDDSVQQLIFVKYKSGSDADVVMYNKTADSSHGWTPIVSCTAFVGREGIGEGKINVFETPVGDHAITTAFGVKSNPGTALPYIDITDDIYCCGDDGEYYNKIINAAELDHTCSGEHMADFVPEYDYGFFYDYNKEQVYDKGYAFSFHCKGKKTYTGGCIAVDEDDMIRILKRLTPGARICTDNE